MITLRAFRHFLMALLVVAAPAAAIGQTFTVGDIEIVQPWSRATPQGAKVAAGYLQLTNKGASPDRLIAASTEIAGRVELHEMAVREGVMTMRPVAGGILVEPGKTVKLAPGGLHIMFMDITGPLKQGGTFTATLVFEKGGKVSVPFAVQGMGAREPAHRGH